MNICQNGKIVGADAPREQKGLKVTDIQTLAALIQKCNDQQLETLRIKVEKEKEKRR